MHLSFCSFCSFLHFFFSVFTQLEWKGEIAIPVISVVSPRLLDQIRQNILANKRRCYRYAQTWYPRAQILALFLSHPPRQESDREDRRWNSFFHHHHHLILLSVGTLWNAVRKLLLRCRHRHHRQISTPWDKDFQSAPRIIIIAISVITKMKKISMNQCLDREGALSQMPSKETWEIRWLTP